VRPQSCGGVSGRATVARVAPQAPEPIGRSSEVRQLAEVIGRVPQGLAAAVVTGPAGVGKTVVWRRAVDLAREAGCTILSARPAEAEVRHSYGGLTDLLGGLEAEWLQALPIPQQAALEVALLRRSASADGVDARTVASGVLSLLRAIAAVTPVLVAVDDAQWLDGSTAAALGFALRRLEDAAVGVLAAVRVGDMRPAVFLDGMSDERRLDVPLGPLSAASIHAIVSERLGWAPTRPTLVKVVAVTGGNPFYALEVARELQRLGSSSPGEVLPIPKDLRALLYARVDRLSADSREALLMASCLAAPHTSLVPEEALADAESLRIINVAADGRIEFAHPLLAAAVYESAATAQRRLVHRRLAELVSDPEERARHRALAVVGADPDVASALDQAASIARRRGAPGAAAELIELALRLDPNGDARVDRQLAAAAAHFDAGDLDRAQELLEAASAGAASGPSRARALRALGHVHVRRGGFGEAIELALAARAAATDDRSLAAEAELDLAFYRFNAGDFLDSETHARAAVSLAAEADIDGLVASALAVQTVTSFLCGRGVNEPDLRRALAWEDPQREGPLALRPRFVAGFLALCTGRLREAVQTLDAIRREALDSGLESDAPMVFLYLVWASAWCGELDAAARFAEEARQTAAQLDDRMADALALSARALAHAWAGETGPARQTSESSIDQFERMQWWAGTIWPRWARAHLELSLGDPAAAYDALRPLTEVLPVGAPADPILTMFVPEAVESLIALGRIEEARALLEPFEERGRAVDRDWALAAAWRCRGLLQAAEGGLDAAIVSFDRALARHDQTEMASELARTLLELGRVRRRRKEKRLARLALEKAYATFESRGMALWAAQAASELARVTTRKAADGLTATEQRVASLAAEGLTNREIAGRVFVAVSTVEANLKRAYRKLGISSRAQLGRALAERASKGIS
jgi:DNA-binding CsgD family transcriptional regulator